MRISRIEVRNFRALQDVSVDCGDVAAFVGRNGAGKSSFLYALDAFYDVSASISIEDFFDRTPDDPIVIRVSYSELTENERAEFQPYLDGGRLSVTKQISFRGGSIDQRYFAAAPQIREFAALRSLGKRDRIREYKELVDSGKHAGLPTNLRSSEAVDSAMSEYEEAHPELCELVEREEQFFGPPNVGGGKLDKYTRYVHIPAVRDASDEMGKKGSIYQLIDAIVIRKVNERADVQALRTEFEGRVAEVYSPDNLTELGELGSSVTSILEQYAPGAELLLRWGDPRVPDIPPPPAIARLHSDGYACPISHAGHGLQRSLVVALLHQLACVPTSIQSSTLSEDSPSDSVSPSPNLIIGFEEPELYLHPSRCRHLASLLLRLASGDSGGASLNQVLYTTHSPYLVDLERFNEVRLVRRSPTGHGGTLGCRVCSYTLEEAANEIDRINDSDRRVATAQSFRHRASSVFTTTVNEGFFGDVAVVVEGMGDLGILTRLQDIIGLGWSKLGVVVVPANGKENIDRPVVVFRGLGIPTYFVFDGDANDRREQTAKRNRRYLRLASAGVEDYPKSQVHDDWAVFEIDIESEIRAAVGDDEFVGTRDQAAAELGYDQPSRLLKNAEGAAYFVERLYEAKRQIPTLEEIVRAITSLRERSLAD